MIYPLIAKRVITFYRKSEYFGKNNRSGKIVDAIETGMNKFVKEHENVVGASVHSFLDEMIRIAGTFKREPNELIFSLVGMKQITTDKSSHKRKFNNNNNNATHKTKAIVHKKFRGSRQHRQNKSNNHIRTNPRKRRLPVLLASDPVMKKPRIEVQCYRCGKTGHKRNKCFTSKVFCNKCKSDKHNESVCPGTSLTLYTKL